MPRGRGGSRQGQRGKSYPNRSDLNAPKPKIQAAPAKTYGDRTRQLEAQRAVPVAPSPNQQPISAHPRDALGAAESAAAGFQFPSMPPINGETEFGDEPITAGVDMGAGPGREGLGLPDDSITASLRGLYKAEPSEPLREMIEELESKHGA